LGDFWNQLVDCICRPPRDVYTVEDLVGGTDGKFSIARFRGRRQDVTLVNKGGLSLQCSHYIPLDAEGKDVRGKDGKLPCVIYCHCNSGSRRDAEEAVYILIPLGVSVFTLDFAGSGLSEGKWVTLGANEVEDVQCAVDHLRSTGKVSTLGMWGRSMGAVTALMYAQRDPSIAGMVIDSPFSRLTELMLEIVEEQKLPIPKPFLKMAVAAMKRSVRKRAGFEIDKVSPLDAVPQCFIPVLFGHATEDTFIKIAHSEKLHTAYAGDKNLIRFEGDHNSRRPEFFYSSVSVFFHNTLQLDAVLEGGNRLNQELMKAYNSAIFTEASQTPAESHSSMAIDELKRWGSTVREGLFNRSGVRSDAEPGDLINFEDEEEAQLVAAIQMSLLDAGSPQQEPAAAGSSNGPLEAHAREPVQVSQQPQASTTRPPQDAPLAAPPLLLPQPSVLSPLAGHQGPRTSEEEEAMLMEAIRLSLADAAGEQSAQQSSLPANASASLL